MDLIGSDLETDNFGEKQEIQIQMKETEATEIESVKDDLIQFEKKDDSNSETPAQDLEFFLDYSGHQLVPIESIDATTVEFLNNSEVHEDHEFGDFQKAQVTSESTIETVTQELVKATEETLSVLQNSKELESSKLAELDSMEFEETENSLVFHANLSAFSNEKPAMSEENQTPFDSEELKETEENHSGKKLTLITFIFNIDLY